MWEGRFRFRKYRKPTPSDNVFFWPATVPESKPRRSGTLRTTDFIVIHVLLCTVYGIKWARTFNFPFARSLVKKLIMLVIMPALYKIAHVQDRHIFLLRLRRNDTQVYCIFWCRGKCRFFAVRMHAASITCWEKRAKEKNCVFTWLRGHQNTNGTFVAPEKSINADTLQVI